ncbi:hypothetical protein GJR88_03613 [Dietzia sp. DQ12-45-1b]|nr:hypothetical protein GJR88_03613 [Dietzia sp. DQ12-45-1b]
MAREGRNWEPACAEQQWTVTSRAPGEAIANVQTTAMV